MSQERRDDMWQIYFTIGDFLACAITGAVTAWLIQAAIPAGWYMIPGMLAGMVLGTLAGIIGAILFTPLLGALEVMLPVSLSGMVAGMGAGMAETMAHSGLAGSVGITGSEALMGGALAGLACSGFTYFLQARLRGDVKLPGMT